jgi:Ni/Fe-hydrogenase subunit HybB-like protein
MLYPTPHSLMFWDMFSLMGYLVLNVVISHFVLDAERQGVHPPAWLRPIIILSIPWAISIHTVTAFLYCGLAARPFWMSAILAPRFLASAFASGPALLILIALVVRRFSRFDPGQEALGKLGLIVTYAMIINVFFVLMEIFTAFYAQIPDDVEHFQYLFVGLQGHRTLVPWMWVSVALAVVALVLLINPRTRGSERTLALACGAVFASIWIDKGLGMVVTGFTPSPFGQVTSYTPTFPELMISLGIWAMGFVLITVLSRIAISVRGQAIA